MIPDRRAAGCTGKDGFLTWTQASLIARASRRRRDTKVSVYKCRFCHRWHIGEDFMKVKEQRT